LVPCERDSPSDEEIQPNQGVVVDLFGAPFADVVVPVVVEPWLPISSIA
jgi:hypothetical protein